MKTGSVFSEAAVIVTEKAVQGQVRFAEESYEVLEDETITVKYELESGDYRDIVWSVENGDLIEIDTDTEGEIKISGKNYGVTDVTAKLGESVSVFTAVVLTRLKAEESYDATKDSKETVTGYYSVEFRQSDARDLSALVNNYRLNTAHVQSMTYDYKLEEYAMQRAAEIVMFLSDTRPNGESWKSVLPSPYYGCAYAENLFGGVIPNSGAARQKILSDGNLLSKTVRAANASFGVAHAVYEGEDYWVMIFCNKRFDTPQTTPENGKKTMGVRIRGSLYSNPAFVSTKSIIKVNCGKTAALPNISSTIRVKLGGKPVDIPFDWMKNHYNPALWRLDSVGIKYAAIMLDSSTYRIHAGDKPNNDERAYIVYPVSFNKTEYTVKTELRVIRPVTGVIVEPDHAKVYTRESVRLTATVLPEDATDKTVIWSTSNSLIASVSSTGLVTGRNKGTAKIAVTTVDGGYTDICTVDVEVKPQGIYFEIDEETMTPGLTDKLVPVFVPANTTNKKVTFKSSDPTRVSVETAPDHSYGTIRALKLTEKGKPVIITMTSEEDKSLSATLPVTVREKDRVQKPTGSTLYDSKYELPLYEDDGFPNYIVKGDTISLHTDTRDAEIYYTKDGSDPSVSGTLYKEPIRYTGGAFTLKVIAVRNGMLDSEVAAFDIVEEDLPTWEIDDEDLNWAYEKHGGIPEGIWVGVMEREEVYTGSKIFLPEFRVYFRNHRLELNKDYKITYSNNVNTSEDRPAVVISGLGNYKDKKSIQFAIKPLAIEEENGFSYEGEIFLSYTGKYQKPVPVVLWYGKKLKSKTDYTVIYSRDAEGRVPMPEGFIEPGNYYAIIHGVKNFTDGAEKFAVPVHISAEGQLLSKATIKIANTEATGSPIDPDTLDITVKLGGKILEQGVDYVVDHTNPDPLQEIGTASVTVRAKEGRAYFGEKTGTVKITGRPLKNVKIYCLGNSVVYTGSAITLEDLYVDDGSGCDQETLYDGNRKLQEGTDYLVEVNGQNKGKGTVRFTGLGIYADAVTRNFTVREKPLSGNDVIVDIFETTYSKTGAVPYVSVFLKGPGEEYGAYLEEGKDYTLKLTNNKNVYTDPTFREKYPPTAALTFKGNYKGSVAKNFLILAQNLDTMTITAADYVYSASKKGAKCYVKPVITDEDGKTLAMNKDYTVRYYYAQNSRVNGSPEPNRSYGTEIRENDIPDAGTVIAVEATGIGAYEGTIVGTYKVLANGMNISSASVKINYPGGAKYFEYTGGQIIPRNGNLTVSSKGRILTMGVDYEIQSISNNVRAGTATMVLHGRGEYGGTKKVTFKIGKKTMSFIEYMMFALGLSFD